MNNSNHDEYLPEEIPASETPVSPLSSTPELPGPSKLGWTLPPETGDWIYSAPGFPPQHAEPNVDHTPAEKPPGGLFGWSEVFCWGLIICITGFIFLVTVWEQLSPSSASSDASQKKGHLMQIQLNGKFMVFGKGTGNPDIMGAINARDLVRQGSVMERCAGVILVAETESPQLALRLLDDIDSDIRHYGYQPTEMEVRLRAVLENILQRRAQARVFDGREFDFDDREFLVQQLGWLGKVALTPASSPDLETRREIETAATVATVGVLVLGLGFIGIVLLGFCLLITGIVLAANGKMRGRLPNWSGNGLIYLETFTIWLIIFFGMQFSLLAVGMPQHQMISLLPFVFFGSLGVLIWPLVRGVGLSQMLSDLGLSGPGKIANAFLGIPSYLAIAPVVVVAAIVNLVAAGFVLSTVLPDSNPFDPSQGVGHPLQDELAAAGPWAMWGVVISLCVAAPIVEEIFFRGVFYRYLRDRFARWHRWLAVVAAALINSTIFAAIHPQGIMGILLLTTLAIGLTLAREWRSSLLPSIVMHAINNSLVTVLMLVVFFS